MADKSYYLRKKSDPEWLARKRERDRLNQQRKRERDPEKTRASAKAWRDANKGKVAEYNHQQWLKTKADAEKLERNRRRNRAENLSADQLEKKRERGREYSHARKVEAWRQGTTVHEATITPEKREQKRQYQAKWRADNPERSRELGREATQRYRDKRGPRAAIDTYAYKALRQALVAADAKSRYFPGYTGRELKAHILPQLEAWGWTIGDYGSKWEFDHIVPVSAFDYQSVEDEQYRRCWSLENLRPLCKIENRQKGGLRR